MKNILLISALLLFRIIYIHSQEDKVINWWNPVDCEYPVIEGQAWGGQLEDPYDRLPARAESEVRKAVWDLSKHAAGLKLRFRSNAEEIVVRYVVGGRHEMNHMPATGVSGVDLYAIDSDGEWMWCMGGRTFSDTITYRYSNLRPNDGYHDFGREYRLSLPLYNNVEWLAIGTAEGSYFRPLPIRKALPIVVYGTSIAQGACASRPGMAWTNILGRKMDRPVINLGFSGNGRLEKELIELLAEIEARIYILDCLPNLWSADHYDDDELRHRILTSVLQLRQERPGVPILLVAHAGYTDGQISPKRREAYSRVNIIQKEVFAQLLGEGVSDLHYLTKEALAVQLDDMVDGTHPNDLGMMHYASAYEEALRSILKEPIGEASTTIPTIQYREPANYDWEERHREILALNKSTPPKSVIMANSIIHFWGGTPRAKIAREEASWSNHFTPMGIRNHAYGWDRIENVLWRVYHGELDGYTANRIIVMIGTNNLHLNTDDEIVAGLSLLLKAIKERQPEASLIMMGLLPRRDQELRISVLNHKIAQLTANGGAGYGDVGEVFLRSDGKIDESLFSDGLHPNKQGYEKMRPLIMSLLE